MFVKKNTGGFRLVEQKEQNMISYFKLHVVFNLLSLVVKTKGTLCAVKVRVGHASIIKCYMCCKLQNRTRIKSTTGGSGDMIFQTINFEIM